MGKHPTTFNKLTYNIIKILIELPDGHEKVSPHTQVPGNLLRIRIGLKKYGLAEEQRSVNVFSQIIVKALIRNTNR